MQEDVGLTHTCMDYVTRREGLRTGPYVTEASIFQQEPSLDDPAKVTCTTKVTPHSLPVIV